MKRIIRGRMYDTETAREVYEASFGCVSDFKYFEETLFCKRTGEYFLYGYGHAASKYAEQDSLGSWCAGSSITPLTYEQAMDWAEHNMRADEYQAEFGEVSEGDCSEGVVLSLRVSPAVRDKVRRMAAESGRSQRSVVEELIINA